jgi:AcrR family transcriptional regulator
MADSGTAVRLSRAARRAQLLAAARATFVESGYHAAAMDDIAERAGVSKPVLYQHFPSKLELYVALVGQTANELVAAVRAAIDSTTDNDTRVHRAVEAIFNFVGAGSPGWIPAAADGVVVAPHERLASSADGVHRLVFESDLSGNPEVGRIVAAMTDACIEAISVPIVVDTGVDAAHARMLAAGLVGLSQVSARYWLVQEHPVPVNEAVEMIYTLAWRGISRFPRAAHG